MSVEYKSAMQSLITFDNQHFRLRLPWRDESMRLPNNMALALACLQQLRRKLYHDFIASCAEIGNDYRAKCLFDFYVPSTISQLWGDGFSWVKPVLS